MMVYNLELRNQTMWVRAKMWAQKEGKKRAEKLTDEKNFKTQATAQNFISDFCSFFSAREELNGHKIVSLRSNAHYYYSTARVFILQITNRAKAALTKKTKKTRRILDDNDEE